VGYLTRRGGSWTLCRRRFINTLPAGKGFALLEVLVAFTLLSIVMVPLMNIFSVTGRINADTVRMGTALSLAQSKLEEILDCPFGAVADIPERDFGEDDVFAEYAGYRYSVTVTEHSPVLKTVEVRVFYHNANDIRKEVDLRRDIARR